MNVFDVCLSSVFDIYFLKLSYHVVRVLEDQGLIRSIPKMKASLEKIYQVQTSDKDTKSQS